MHHGPTNILVHHGVIQILRSRCNPDFHRFEESTTLRIVVEQCLLSFGGACSFVSVPVIVHCPSHLVFVCDRVTLLSVSANHDCQGW